MPITFGSVGDIISLSILIKDLVRSLDNSRGSPAEYQAVIRELWGLDHALLEVEVLFRSCEQTVYLRALRVTVNECVEQCRNCIVKFHEQIKKFEKSLQSGGSDSFIRDIAMKIRWQVSKDDLAKFRAEINAHCFSINMLLTTTGVTLAKLNDENVQTSLRQSELSHAKSSATQAYELTEIKSRLEDNNALIKAAASETKDLGLRFDMDYLKSLGADILSFMQKIWKVNFLTYKAVISLQTSIPAQLERCWTQEPATLEDALGRVTAVHLEFLDSWEAFEAVLEVRFRQLPGHRKIRQGEYALQASSWERDVERSLALNRCFLPGQRINMSMIFDGKFGRLSSCPGCHLVTSKTEEELDSQVQCPRCKMWYQQVLQKTTTEPKPMSMIEPKVVAQDTQLPTPPQRKRQWTEDEELDDNPAHFRRVRLRYWNQSHKLGRSPAYQDADYSPKSSAKTITAKAASTQAAPLETPTSRTGVGQTPLQQIFESAVDRSSKIENPALGIAFEQLYEASLRNSVNDHHEAVLFQKPALQPIVALQSYLKAGKKQIRAYNKLDSAELQRIAASFERQAF